MSGSRVPRDPTISQEMRRFLDQMARDADAVDTAASTYLLKASNLSDVASAATAFTNIKQAASDTATGVVELATAAEITTGTDVERAVTPGRQHAHSSAAKFWAVVNVTAGTHALVASYNVTSITDGLAGLHTVTIATDFSSADWCCSGTAQGSGTTSTTAKVVSTSSKAAGSIVVGTYDLDATGPILEDAVSVSTVGFGTQA